MTHSYRTSLRVQGLTRQEETKLRHVLLRHAIDMFEEQGLHYKGHIFETTDTKDGFKDYGIYAIAITSDTEDHDTQEPTCNKKVAAL